MVEDVAGSVGVECGHVDGGIPQEGGVRAALVAGQIKGSKSDSGLERRGRGVGRGDQLDYFAQGKVQFLLRYWRGESA